MNLPASDSAPNVLVTDFDGTLTQVDFYRVVMQRLLPPGSPTYWEEFRAGEITHFDALKRIFAAIEHTEAEVVELLEQMQLDPDLRTTVQRLEAADWQVVVVSAGCRWYIDQLLTTAGVAIDIHASPGRFVPGQGLVMELPHESPYFSPTHGIDKAAAVQAAQQRAKRVAFAGNSESDLEAARLVPGHLRFAREDLPRLLDREGLQYQRFERWSEIASVLLATDEP